MLARLKMGVRRVLDVQVDTAICSSATDEEDLLVIDLHALRNLVFPFPNNAWRSVVNCGGTFPPMYGTLQNAVSNDFKNIVQVLSELEPTWDSDILDETADGFDDACPMNLGSSYVEPEPYIPVQSRINRSRQHSADIDDAPCIRPGSASVPTIIITPCEPQESEISSRVPLQNCAFGNRLTVPRHPVFNQAFPPLSPSPHTLYGHIKWRWQGGHWQATLPSLEEQAQKGLFSRAPVLKSVSDDGDKTIDRISC